MILSRREGTRVPDTSRINKQVPRQIPTLRSLLLFSLNATSSPSLASPTTLSNNAAPSQSPPDLSPEFSWNSISSQVTCTETLFTWKYNGRDDGLVNITITNSGVNQNLSSTLTIPQPFRAAANTISESIVASFAASQGGVPWLEVDVTPGYYVLIASSDSFLSAASLPFLVTNGKDTSCINPLFLDPNGSPNVTISTTDGISSSNATSTGTLTSPSALPAQDNKMNEIIAGSVGGGLVVIIFIGICISLISRNLKNRRRSRMTIVTPSHSAYPPEISSEKDDDNDEFIQIVQPTPPFRRHPMPSYNSEMSSISNTIPDYPEGVFSTLQQRPRVDSNVSKASISRSPTIPYVPKMNFSLPNSPTFNEHPHKTTMVPDMRRNKPSISESVQSNTHTVAEEEELEDITPAYPSGGSIELSQLSTVVASTILGKQSDVSKYSRPSSADIHVHPFVDVWDSSEKGYNLQDPSLSYGDDRSEGAVNSPLRTMFSSF